MLNNFLLVGAGGAVGAMLRYGMTLLCVMMQWSQNLGTFLVNVIGSFAIGILVSVVDQSSWLLMATVGICGGFTTFSTFSLQTVQLLQQGKYGMAAVYIVATAVLCVAFAALGCYVGQKLK